MQRARPPDTPTKRRAAHHYILGLLREVGHASAEEVRAGLSRRGLELALSSVYLALHELCREGSARRFRGAGRTLFEAGGEVHAHLVCRSCGCVHDLPLPGAYLRALEAESAARGWRAPTPHLTLFGRCPNCLRREPAA